MTCRRDMEGGYFISEVAQDHSEQGLGTCCELPLLCSSFLACLSACSRSRGPGPKITASQEDLIRTPIICIWLGQGRGTGGRALSLSLQLRLKNKACSGALMRPNQPGVSGLTALSRGVGTCVPWGRARQSAMTVTGRVSLSF